MKEEILEPVVDTKMTEKEIDETMNEFDFRCARLWQAMIKSEENKNYDTRT